MKLSSPAYLACSLGLAFAILGAIAGFNYGVDPCGIYHEGVRWDWTRSRPEILETELVHKARAITTARADVLLMGSSRSAEGLDPLNPVLPPHTYNLALPQAGLYEAWRYLQHACAVHVPQTVVLGVEYVWAGPDRAQADLFSDDRLLVQPDGRPTPALTYHFADLTWTLFSAAATRFSLATLRAPTEPRMTFTAGFEADAPLVVEHLDRAANVLKATDHFVTRLNPGPFRYPDGTAPQMEAYRRLLALCAEKHIRLIVFTQPAHALMLDKLTQSWSDYCDWMRTVAAQLEATPGLKAELWDFCGYNSISTEPLPSPGDSASRMRYYWEGSHYRKIVGDMVLQRIFAGTGPDSFGRIVTIATVDQDLQRLMNEKEAWHNHGQAMAIDLPPSAVRTKNN